MDDKLDPDEPNNTKPDQLKPKLDKTDKTIKTSKTIKNNNIKPDMTTLDSEKAAVGEGDAHEPNNIFKVNNTNPSQPKPNKTTVESDDGDVDEVAAVHDPSNNIRPRKPKPNKSTVESDDGDVDEVAAVHDPSNITKFNNIRPRKPKPTMDNPAVDDGSVHVPNNIFKANNIEAA